MTGCTPAGRFWSELAARDQLEIEANDDASVQHTSSELAKASLNASCSGMLHAKSRYNNRLIAKLISNFDDMKKRREEREESLAPN